MVFLDYDSIFTNPHWECIAHAQYNLLNIVKESTNILVNDRIRPVVAEKKITPARPYLINSEPGEESREYNTSVSLYGSNTNTLMLVLLSLLLKHNTHTLEWIFIF
jgi:hypothetical protein